MERVSKLRFNLRVHRCILTSHHMKYSGEMIAYFYNKAEALPKEMLICLHNKRVVEILISYLTLFKLLRVNFAIIQRSDQRDDQLVITQKRKQDINIPTSASCPTSCSLETRFVLLFSSNIFFSRLLLSNHRTESFAFFSPQAVRTVRQDRPNPTFKIRYCKIVPFIPRYGKY